jgi:class 3 adenylate cyclase
LANRFSGALGVSSSVLRDRRPDTAVSRDPGRALLLIGDIRGYTRFMRLHRLSLAHSQEVIGRLLEALAGAAGEVELVEFEGDAAFFFRPEADLGGSPSLGWPSDRRTQCTRRSTPSGSSWRR